jgi:hypothetical protein
LLTQYVIITEDDDGDVELAFCKIVIVFLVFFITSSSPICIVVNKRLCPVFVTIETGAETPSTVKKDENKGFFEKLMDKISSKKTEEKKEAATSESKNKSSDPASTKKSGKKGFFSSLIEKIKPKEESKESEPKNEKVKPEMAEHVFPSLEMDDFKKCNVCDPACEFDMIDSRMKDEENLTKPKASNDFFKVR